MTNDSLAKICLELGSNACRRGDYHLTQMLYEAANSQPDHSTVIRLASSMARIADIYAEQAHFHEARTLYKMAFTIFSGIATGVERQMRDLLDKLALLCEQDGDRAQALEFYEQAMEIDMSLGEVDSEKAHDRRLQLVWLQLQQGRFPRSFHLPSSETPEMFTCND